MNHNLYLKDPGIYKENNTYYFHDTHRKIVRDLKIIERLNSFKVPPAWKNVWYASSKNSHIQVHGIDVSGKKQYILSEKWIHSKNAEKFNRMDSFIKKINYFKNKIKIYPNQIIDRIFVIKLLFNLLLDTHIRVGNEIYAVKNQTYGLTTLKQKHLIKNNNKYSLSFVGKSNIEHDIEIPDKYCIFLKKFIKNNKPEFPLFYYLENNKLKTIQSEELNNFLKENMGEQYTCKDFRTYSANILFIKEFIKHSNNSDLNINQVSKIKKIIMNCIDKSAHFLGHTRTISKKSYINNNLIDYCIESFPTASKDSFSTLVSKISS